MWTSGTIKLFFLLINQFKLYRWRKEHGGESSSEEESADAKSGSGSSEESDSDDDVSVV